MSVSMTNTMEESHTLGYLGNETEVVTPIQSTAAQSSDSDIYGDTSVPSNVSDDESEIEVARPKGSARKATTEITGNGHEKRSEDDEKKNPKATDDSEKEIRSDPIELSSDIATSTVEEPSLRPWRDPHWTLATRRAYEETFLILINAPSTDSKDILEKFLKIVDEELLRYMSDYPLERWVVGEALARKAYQQYVCRERIRRAGGHVSDFIRARGPEQTSGSFEPRDCMPLIPIQPLGVLQRSNIQCQNGSSRRPPVLTPHAHEILYSVQPNGLPETASPNINTRAIATSHIGHRSHILQIPQTQRLEMPPLQTQRQQQHQSEQQSKHQQASNAEPIDLTENTPHNSSRCSSEQPVLPSSKRPLTGTTCQSIPKRKGRK